jgi:hypothetical protein
MQRIMITVNVKIVPIMPKNNWIRKICFLIVQSNKFEYFIFFVISLNTLFLCMNYDESPPLYNSVLNYGNIVFVSIYALELVLKVIAYGPKMYWNVNWNKFDIFIVILSLITIDQSLFTINITALRIIRVARLLRMIKASKRLRGLLKALYMSLTNIANVGALLFLIFFVFSVAGMSLFGTMAYGAFICSDANFSTFYLAITTLIRASTGENWNGLMHDCYS